MSGTTIQTLLESFETQIAEGNFAEAENTLDEIESRYESESVDRSAKYGTAMAAITQTDPLEESAEDLTEYGKYTAAVPLRRSEFLLKAATFLAEPEEFDESELVELTESLRADESDLQNAEESAETVIEATTLPARPEIVAVQPVEQLVVGNQTPVEIEVRNVGDELAGEVQLNVSGDETLEVNPESQTLGNIQAGERQRVEITARPSEEGSNQLTVTASTNNGAPTNQIVTISVADQDTPDVTEDDSNVDPEEAPDISTGQLAGLGLAGVAILYAAAQMRSDDDDESWDEEDPW